MTFFKKTTSGLDTSPKHSRNGERESRGLIHTLGPAQNQRLEDVGQNSPSSSLLHFLPSLSVRRFLGDIPKGTPFGRRDPSHFQDGAVRYAKRPHRLELRLVAGVSQTCVLVSLVCSVWLGVHFASSACSSAGGQRPHIRSRVLRCSLPDWLAP